MPCEWAGEQVELLWDSSSEAMIWSTDGVPRQGLTGDSKTQFFYVQTVLKSSPSHNELPINYYIEGNDRRVEYPLLKKAKGGETVELYIEMACNGMFGAGKNGLINPPEEDRKFQLCQGNSLSAAASDIVLPWCL